MHRRNSKNDKTVIPFQYKLLLCACLQCTSALIALLEWMNQCVFLKFSLFVIIAHHHILEK